MRVFNFLMIIIFILIVAISCASAVSSDFSSINGQDFVDGDFTPHIINGSDFLSVISRPSVSLDINGLQCLEKPKEPLW